MLWERKSPKTRMYVLVDKGMPLPDCELVFPIEELGRLFERSYNHVQATHAVAQYMLCYPKRARVWNNQTLIVLGVSSRQLEYYRKLLKKIKCPCATFQEPDIGNYTTALATILYPNQFKMFKRLSLL
jgi:hypothetical protein